MKTGPMHPGMHPIDDNFVRRLIAGQFPQWAGLALRRWPSGGTVNAMYRLGDDMVARLPLVEGGAKDVSMEQEWLHRRAPHLPTRIPEVLGAGQPPRGTRGRGRRTAGWRGTIPRWGR
jgi:aminoglycoside phosphotransferase (APT) family kinase protein